MSSFNIYDNYSSFNDLINRTEFLEEKTYKAMVKGANLGPELKKYKTEDGKGLSATSRIKNLILISALVQMDMLDEDIAKTLRKKATSSTYITNTLKELAPKVHAELFDGDSPGSEEVVKYVQNNIEQLLPFAVKNVTRGEFERKEVDTEEPDNEEAKELEDEVSAEVRLAKGLIDQEADKVELDFDDVDVNFEGLDNKDEVAAKITELINTTNNLKAEPTGVGLNIEGPIGVFGSEEKVSDQMTRLITKYFPNVSEGQIKVTLNTDQEEDYEEGPEPMEPEEPVNEYEEDINDAEEDAEYKGKWSPKYAKKVEKEFAKHVRLRSPDGKLGVKLPPGNKEEIEDYKERGYVEDNEFDDFDIGPQSDENVPDDYEEVLKAMVTKDKEQFAKNMIEDEEGGMRLKELEIGGHRYEVGVDDPHDDGIVIDIEKNKNGYTITGAVYSDPMDYYEDPNDMKEGYRYAIDQDGKYIGAPEDEERINEAIKMQPHLEVSETSTAAYLTEQKQSDKRNKKAEVKNQSFKEKYKPKTHWQLEELRRYGL